jgi:anti-sigma factor RsiW
MNCHDCQPLLSAYIDESVRADERVAVDRHLRSCDAVSAHWQTTRRNPRHSRLARATRPACPCLASARCRSGRAARTFSVRMVQLAPTDGDGNGVC